MSDFNIKEPLNIFMILTLVLGLGIGGYAWFFVFEEVNLEKNELQAKVDKNNLEIKSLIQTKTVESKLDQDLKEAQVELKELQKMFPDLEDVTKRLRDLYVVFRQANIDVETFSPSGVGGGAPTVKGKIDWDNPKAYYQENYYTVSLKTGYHSLGEFFAHVANFDYPTRVDDLKLTAVSGLVAAINEAEITGQQPKTLNVKLKLTTFTSRSAKEEPKSKVNPKKGKK